MLLVGRGLRDELAERIRYKRIAPEFNAILHGSFKSDAVDRGHVDSIGDRVPTLDGQPGIQLGRAGLRFPRMALLFLALTITLARPHMPTIAALLSPTEMFYRLDRGVQGIYAKGLKAYGTKNDWQAQFTFFKNNVLHKLGLMIEQLDVPVQTNGKQKSGEPRQRQEKAPSQKSSLLLLPA